jgi:hypothetical protein
MASKVIPKITPTSKPSNEIMDLDTIDYCSDCIYHWCSKRSKVLFCTLKSKGFFECKSCMLKLVERLS